MPISEAKLAANRKNAMLSRGPSTPDGKAISRRNALKHGLTGRGVALPQEDQDEVDRRFTAMLDDFRPRTDAGSRLIRRYAFLSVRIERCERHETKQTAMRTRHAVARFDDERLAAVEALGARIYTEPATTSRRLQMTPEGIDWLLDEWEVLRGDLTRPDPNRWTHNHRMHFDALLGRNPGGYRVARVMALSEAMGGFFHHLDPSDGEGLDKPERAEWAKSELTRLIDAEMGRLKEARVGLDPEAIALDRAEAVDRALFDTSPEATLARKYEAAAVREMHRTLKEFRQVEAEAAEGIEPSLSRCEIEEDDPVGSNSQDVEEEAPEAEPEGSGPPPTVDFAPSPPTVLNISIGRPPEIGPEPAGIIGIG